MGDSQHTQNSKKKKKNQKSFYHFVYVNDFVVLFPPKLSRGQKTLLDHISPLNSLLIHNY